MCPKWSVAGLHGSDNEAHVADVLLEQVDAFFSKVNAGKGVRNVIDIVGAVAQARASASLVDPLQPCVPTAASLPKAPAGSSTHPVRGNQSDAYIHLQESETESMRSLSACPFSSPSGLR